MSVTAKTIEGLAIIMGSLALGYLSRKAGWLRLERARKINEVNLSYFTPWVIILVLWALEPIGWEVAVLPVISALAILLMWPLAALLGQRLFTEPRSLAPWVICSMFSNQGFTFGGFLCYILLGTQGAALASIYTIPFAPMVYLVGFYIAGYYVRGEGLLPWQALAQTARHSYSRNPMLGVLAGLLLFAVGPPLPELGLRSIDVVVPLSAGVALFAIGVSLRPSRVPGYLRPVALIHVLKFVVTPLLGLSLAYLFGLWGKADNQLVKVVFIETSTPVAIISLVVAQVTHLNVDLANSLWVTTNLVAVAWAPMLLLLARML